MSILVPIQDLAPSLPSRIVTLKFADMLEGLPAGETGWVEFELPGDLRVPADKTVVKAGRKKVELSTSSEGQIRLPVYSTAAVADSGDGEWALNVRKSWTRQVDAIRVPAGATAISLAEINPIRHVPPGLSKWLLTGAAIELIEGPAWDATVETAGGVATFKLTVPPVVQGPKGDSGQLGVQPLVYERDTIPTSALEADVGTRGLWHLDASLGDASAYDKPLSLVPSTPAGVFASDRVFGLRSLESGVYTAAGADSFVSSNGANGGAFTTFTVEAWIKAARHTTPKVAVSHVGWFWLGINGAGVAAAEIGTSTAAKNLAGSTVIAPASINDAIWHHVALVFNAATSTVYLIVDGKTEASAAFSGNTGATAGAAFCVGGFNTIRAYDFATTTGRIDEVRLSSSARYFDRTGTYPPRPVGLPPGYAEYIGLASPTDARPFDRWMKVAT